MATTAQVPGAITDPNAILIRRTAAGRCPRCERWPYEPGCPGVEGEITHLGS